MTTYATLNTDNQVFELLKGAYGNEFQGMDKQLKLQFRACLAYLNLHRQSDLNNPASLVSEAIFDVAPGLGKTPGEQHLTWCCHLSRDSVEHLIVYLSQSLLLGVK